MSVFLGTMNFTRSDTVDFESETGLECAINCWECLRETNIVHILKTLWSAMLSIIVIYTIINK